MNDCQCLNPLLLRLRVDPLLDTQLRFSRQPALGNTPLWETHQRNARREKKTGQADALME